MPVDSKHGLYSKSLPDWVQVRDCMAGERAIKAKGEEYLPRLSGMSDDEYLRYKKKVHFFGATARVADGLHGAVFSKPPQIAGEVPEQVLDAIRDVDLLGTTLDQFASDVVWDAMLTNWGGILVDYSKDAETVPLAEAEQRGYGAFMKWYQAESVINWRYGLVNGKEKLVMLVLHEPYSEVNPLDQFTEETFSRYRVLRLSLREGGFGEYVQDIYDDQVSMDTPVERDIPIRIRGEALYHIPFYPVPGKLPEKAMLLDLSFLNIGHYQESADYQNGKHYTSIPTPIATGCYPETDENGNAKPTFIGGTKFLHFNNESGAPIDVRFLEFSGQGMKALRDGINLTESQMAIMGAHIITAEKKGVESAAVAGIHRAGENGVLGAFTRNVSEQITKAVRMFLYWNGFEAESGDFDYQLNTDYETRADEARMLQVLLQGRQAGEFPKVTLYRFLKKAEAIPDDWDFDTFLAELESDTEWDASRRLYLDDGNTGGEPDPGAQE